jgi:hypothetical protein
VQHLRERLEEPQVVVVFIAVCHHFPVFTFTSTTLI